MVDAMRQHGAFSWCELVTTDVEAAKKFYTKLFGWSTESVSMPGMQYTVVKAAGEDIGGIMAMPPQAKGAPPHWGIYVTVEDVDATVKLAEQMGAKIIVPLTDIPNVGRFCTFQDPQGALISIITYLRR
jgi:predicted enzyme related to lactoylglutathione lyase